MIINTLTSKAMDVDVEKEVKKWLTFTTEWDGGRKMREERRRTEEAAWNVCVLHCISLQ